MSAPNNTSWSNFYGKGGYVWRIYGYGRLWIWIYGLTLLISYFLKDVEGWRCKYTWTAWVTWHYYTLHTSCVTLGCFRFSFVRLYCKHLTHTLGVDHWVVAVVMNYLLYQRREPRELGFFCHRWRASHACGVAECHAETEVWTNVTGLGGKGGASDLSSRHQGGICEKFRNNVVNPAANLKSGMVSTIGKGYPWALI